MAIGSGELVFWPQLSLTGGAGVLWIALAVVLLQYLLNVEIGRYSMATGESAMLGATRLWRGWAWVLLVATVLPWLWPGWARAGCQVLAAATGLAERPLSVLSLLLCGLMLALPARVYALVERVQVVFLGFIIAGVLGLCALALTPSGASGFWGDFLGGHGLLPLLGRATQAHSTEYMALLGGIVFAGGGGILNLGYGLLLCEKRFGLGAYARPVVGLRHSIGLGSSGDAPPGLGSDTETRERWAGWMRLCRREHLLLFAGSNAFAIVCLALTFYALLGPGAQGTGMSFLGAASRRFGALGGPGLSALFVAVAFVIFFTSELGILDVTARLAAGVLHAHAGTRLSASTLYHAVVWFEIAVGCILIALDPRQPYWFLVTSGVLNTVVMALYATLVVWLNRRRLPAFARPGRAASLAVLLTAGLYAALFLFTLRQLWGAAAS
jgi:hypothetical protein